MAWRRVLGARLAGVADRLELPGTGLIARTTDLLSDPFGLDGREGPFHPDMIPAIARAALGSAWPEGAANISATRATKLSGLPPLTRVPGAGRRKSPSLSSCDIERPHLYMPAVLWLM